MLSMPITLYQNYELIYNYLAQSTLEITIPHIRYLGTYLPTLRPVDYSTLSEKNQLITRVPTGGSLNSDNDNVRSNVTFSSRWDTYLKFESLEGNTIEFKIFHYTVNVA